MEISRIVVGIDFSTESEVAAKYAIKIARHTGAEVVLVHAGLVPDTHRPLPLTRTAHEWERLVEQELVATRKRLESMRMRLGSSLPNISHMVINGFADTGLCDAGKQLSADLVITGTHGRTGIKRFLLGSVAERVVRLYNRNVMVARPGAEGIGGGFQRILVPTDFSPHAENALRMALVLGADECHIDVVHCWDTPPELALEWTGSLLDELAAEARQAGAKLLKKHHREGATIRFEEIRAQAVEGIYEHMDKHDYDLVIMGSHGRRGLRRFLLGSVAEVTVRHAPCSTFVVHLQES